MGDLDTSHTTAINYDGANIDLISFFDNLVINSRYIPLYIPNVFNWG